MKKICIGIDFSKETFDATIIRERENFEADDRFYAKFDNNKTGYRKFLKWCKTNAEKRPTSEWIIFGENTGVYCLGMAEWAYAHDLDICIANSYDVKESTGMKREKNDKIDSQRIAEYGINKMMNHKPIYLYHPLPQKLMELKELQRTRQHIDDARKGMQTMLKEKKLVMGDTEWYQKLVDDVEPVIDNMKQTVKKIDKQMIELIDSCTSPEDISIKENFAIITSFKGVALQNGVAMLVYTNNFHDITTANKMTTAWGSAPFGHRSGTSVKGKDHVSGFANHRLKGLLSESATNAIIYNPKIKAYHDRLIKAGKPEGVAINNVRSKIIHIIFTMVQNHQAYDPDYDVKKKDKNIKGETKVLKAS